MPDHLIDATPAEMELWPKRLEAITRALSVIQSRPQKDEIDRHKTIEYLLKQLTTFGQTHFKFFYEGLQHEGQLRLATDPASPQQATSQFVFGTILHQIANDLVVLQRAQEQRHTAIKNVNLILASTLYMADQLAYTMLQKLNVYLSDGLAQTALCYLHLSASSRVVPYAPVALVGIPMSCVGGDEHSFGVIRDLLAIPHELAHYLYWHGEVINKEASGPNSLRANARKDATSRAQPLFSAVEGIGLSASEHEWLNHWMEEIFADVVGCLLVGPVIALYFQDLLLQTRNDWMNMDDGTYPIAVLRPYIFSHTFRYLGMETTAQQLDCRWQKKRDDRALSMNQFFPFRHPQFSVSKAAAGENFSVSPVQNAKQVLQESVEAIVDLVRNIYDHPQGDNSSWFVSLDGLNLSNEDHVEQAYAQFAQRVGTHLERFGTTLGNGALDPDLPTLKWHQLIKTRCIQDDIPPQEGLLPYANWVASLGNWAEGAALSQPLVLDHEIWRPIFEFAGWTTEGPTDGNLHS